MIDLRKYLTVEEVARRLDITKDWIRDLIQTKQLRATKVKRWRINPKNLEEFLKRRTNK